ncbi:MAG: PTS sugar transporter subunit IIA [Betaproteobacteria bacterium TMED156]|nr:MAG: PTS sugar transporter subunit IIA [Betaproteobacteria bacterium TMED156]
MNRLAKILKVDQVIVGVETTSKKRVFEYAGLIFEAKCGISRSKVFDSLFARERLGSTGLGDGIAIPHGRIDGIKEAVAVVLSLSSSISFDANDNLPVNLLIFLLVPTNAAQKHLEILGEVAEMLSDNAFKAELNNSKDAQTLYSKLNTWRPSNAPIS